MSSHIFIGLPDIEFLAADRLFFKEILVALKRRVGQLPSRYRFIQTATGLVDTGSCHCSSSLVFRSVKLRLGHPTLAQDLAVTRAVRSRLPDSTGKLLGGLIAKEDAGYLRNLGVEAGDRVILRTPNIPPALVANFTLTPL